MKDKKSSFWRQFAIEIKGDYIEKESWHSDKAMIELDEFKMICDYYKIYNNTNEFLSYDYTRISIPFRSQENFEFELYDENVFTKIAKAVGWKDIEIGIAAFDRKFHVKSKNPEKIKQLFHYSKLIDELVQLNDCSIEICRQQEIWDEGFNDNEFELKLSKEGKMESFDEVNQHCMILENIFERLKKVSRIMPMK